MVALTYFLKTWQENLHVTEEHTSNHVCMANITFSFAALMLLHWTIHGAKARAELIFFAFLVQTSIYMLKKCWEVSSKKLVSPSSKIQTGTSNIGSFLNFVKYENIYNYLQYP